MRFIGEILGFKNGVLRIKTTDNVSSLIGQCTVDIRPYRNARSLLQNAKLWACIQELADNTGNDIMDIYIAALEHCNAKYEWIAALEEAEDDLKRVFRAVKPVGTVTTAKGQVLIGYKCYIGSSKYNKEEMARLIDFVERKLYE